MNRAIIGVDVGGTNTVIGIFDTTLLLLEKICIPTLKTTSKKTTNPKEFFDVLASKIEDLIIKTGFENMVKCIGIGVPGKVNPEKGIAIHSVNLGYSNVSFAEEMNERLNIPVYIDNDVRNYTRGEAVLGSGKDKKDIVCLTLGTGLAAGVMINGEIITGTDFYAGEIGHDVVIGENYLCNCGKRGCLETIASASGISRLAEEAIQAGKDTSLREINKQITAQYVYEACLKKDHVALEIFDYVGKTLAYKLLTVTYLLNPEVIIIGGGVAAAKEIILEPIQKVFKQFYTANKIPTICLSSLGDAAGVIGSAHLANERQVM